MNHQNFNDFDIESSFQEDDNVVNKPFIPAKPPKAMSPPVRSAFKVIIFILFYLVICKLYLCKYLFMLFKLNFIILYY